jgi:hypothetical protein
LEKSERERVKKVLLLNCIALHQQGCHYNSRDIITHSCLEKLFAQNESKQAMNPNMTHFLGE